MTTTCIEFVDDVYDWKTLTLWNYLNSGHIPSSWNNFFTREDVQEDLRTISLELQKEVMEDKVTIFPALHNVFRAFIPLNKIKVVILGQDPYHSGTDTTNCSAVGYCFSVRPGNDINPSLRSIYKELENEGFSTVRNGDLTHWAKQGCMMLNTALTVARGQADSHTYIWYKFSRKVIEYIVENTNNVAWFFMGSKALDFKKYVNDNHFTMVTSHPMPLAARRGFRGYPGFFGSNAFLKINEYLKEHNRKEIKW